MQNPGHELATIDLRQPADIAAWVEATEATAARAGFLLCGDLPCAARLVEQRMAGYLRELGLDE